MTQDTDTERADFELMREAYEKAFGPPPVGAAWASVGYAIKTHEASEARAYAERFKGFVGGWVWRSAQAAPVPQGWKLVPIEPTPEMIKAADDSDSEYSQRNFGEGGINWSQSGEDHWTAMLAAAPQPPEAAPHIGDCENEVCTGCMPSMPPVTPEEFSRDIAEMVAAPVQMPEPDAGWFKYDKVSECWHPQYEEYAETHAKREGWEKLYTEQQLRQLLAAQERKPLTDAQLDGLALGDDGLPNSHLEFARAIERAHGIKAAA